MVSPQARLSARDRAQAWYETPAGRAVARPMDSRMNRTARRLFVEIALHWLAAAPARVLDTGSGDGEGLADIAARLTAAEIVGVEPEPGMLAAARERVPDRVRLVQAGVEDLPPGLGRFDLVLCHLTFALWPDPGAGLRAMAGALAPGGLLYLSDLVRDAPPAARAAVLAAARSDAERDLLHEQLDASLSRGELVDLCREAGLGDAEVRVGGLGGHGIGTPAAAALYGAHPDVARLLQRLPADGLGPEAADAIVHLTARS